MLCDGCIEIARPWSKGRSALVYDGKARQLILSLKHGDRTDLARAAGPWLIRAGRDILGPDTLIIPVPLHRFRFLRRKFNQASLLAERVARELQIDVLHDGLLRSVKTAPLLGKTRDERFDILQGAITINQLHADKFKDRHIVLLDDVMTSGATFAAATEACLMAGADDVCVLALARAVKDA